jgi:hypothetical protein
LLPYRKDGRITSYLFNFKITERQLGIYDAQAMRIILHGDDAQAELTPVGAFIVGARGRVDLVGPTFKTVKLLLVPKNATGAGSQNKAFSSHVPKRTTTDAADRVEWTWKIATPPPLLDFIELNESTFLDALIYVLES